MRKTFCPAPVASRTVHPESRDRDMFGELSCVCCGAALKHAVVTQHGTLGLSCYTTALGLAKVPASMAAKVASLVKNNRPRLRPEGNKVIGTVVEDLPGGQCQITLRIWIEAFRSTSSSSDVLVCSRRDAESTRALVEAAYGIQP